MKKLKRKYIVATAVLIFSVAVAGMGAAYAATDSGDRLNPMSGLVTAIAQKFNLNETDVQKVFDEQKSNMEVQRQQAFTDRVNQAVTAGTLTQDQATKILAKKAELETLQTSLQGKTEQERATALQNFASSLKQWASDNNIPAGYLPLGGGKMFGGRGTFGKVTANDGTTITMDVTLPGASTATSYTVTAASGATIKKIAKTTGTNVKPTATAIAISDIAAGDTISVRGTISGTTISATNIIDGAMGMGHGRGGRGFGGLR